MADDATGGILDEEYEQEVRSAQEDRHSQEVQVGKRLMTLPEHVMRPLAVKYSAMFRDNPFVPPNAEEFAKKKAEALVAKFPDTTDEEIDGILRWGVEREGLNRARANARKIADQSGLENAGLLTQLGAVVTAGVDALARGASMGLSDVAIKAVAGQDRVDALREVEGKARQTYPTATAVAETTGTLAGLAVSPGLKGMQAAAGKALGRGVAQGAVAFGGYEAATQAIRQAAGTDEGGDPLTAGINGALMGGVLAAAAPRLDIVSQFIGGRAGEAVKGALENLMLLATPRATLQSGLDWHVPSFGEAAGTTLVMAAFGGARGRGLSDPLRRELGKMGIDPATADALAPKIREALTKAEAEAPPPDPALLVPAQAAYEAARGKPEPAKEPVPVESAAERAADPVARDPAMDPAVVAQPAPRVEPAPVAEPSPRPPMEPTDATSIKKRVVNEERVARGLDEMAPPEQQRVEDWRQEALGVLERNPNRGHELTAELANSLRVPDAVESAILTIHRTNLHRSRMEAEKAVVDAASRGDKEAVAEGQTRLDIINDQFLAAEQATQAAGEAWGRSGVARQMEMRQDYTLLAMETRRRVANDGAPLTEAQAAEVKQAHETIARLTAEKEAIEARFLEVSAKRSVGEVMRAREMATSATSSEYGKSNTVFTREAYERTKVALREKLSRLNMGFDPTILTDLAKVGAFHIEAGAHGFAQWAKAMTDDFGDKIKPHLEELWTRAQGQAKETIVGTTSAAIKKGLDSGRGVAQMPMEVGKLAELFVRVGVKDREQLVDAVHEVLRGVDPKITRRETMDAISGYGRIQALDNDPVKVELRELKGQLQQLAKLEDMAAGKAPLKSGPERQAPGDAQRELIKAVNEAKRRWGYGVPDQAAKLKSALSSATTRLRHEIEDLQRQIDTKTKDPENKTSIEYTADVALLRDKRNTLKQEYDALFGKTKLSDEQRVEIAVKATERSIAEYERRIQTGDVFPGERKPATPNDPKLAALREQRDALRQRVEDIRFAALPHKSLHDIALHRVTSQMKSRAAALERRVAEGDFGPSRKMDLIKDRDYIQAEADLETAKREFNRALLSDRLKNRTAAQKAASAVFVETPGLLRSVMTSLDFSAVFRQGGFVTLSHPLRAAKALPDMFRAFRSKEGEARSETEISLRPNYGLARKAGLFLSEHGASSYAKMEEAYMSRWADKVPFVAGSQRAYKAFLNRLRMDSFDAMLAGLSASGRPSLTEAKAIANFVNVATGRGGGKESAAAATLNGIFFSPRLVLSRFQLLALQPAWKGTLATRRMVAGEYARFLGGIGVLYALGSLAGMDIEWDSRSSDFGKMRLGDTRVDPLAGLSQATVLVSRLSTGESKSLAGKVRSIRGDDMKFGSDDGGDVLARFLRTKLAPIPSSAVDLMAGEDVVGEKATVGSEAASLVMPLSLRDIYKTMQAQGIPAGAALGLLSIFGMGVQTYSARKPKPPPKPKAPR